MTDRSAFFASAQQAQLDSLQTPTRIAKDDANNPFTEDPVEAGRSPRDSPQLLKPTISALVSSARHSSPARSQSPARPSAPLTASAAHEPDRKSGLAAEPATGSNNPFGDEQEEEEEEKEINANESTNPFGETGDESSNNPFGDHFD